MLLPCRKAQNENERGKKEQQLFLVKRNSRVCTSRHFWLAMFYCGRRTIQEYIDNNVDTCRLFFCNLNIPVGKVGKKAREGDQFFKQGFGMHRSNIMMTCRVLDIFLVPTNTEIWGLARLQNILKAISCFDHIFY